jgi:aspartokinase
MVTISHTVKKLVDGMPFIHECLGKGMLNYAYAARYLKSRVEPELGRDVDSHAIIMALRRYGEELTRKYESRVPFDYRSEVTLKGGIIDIALQTSPTIFGKLKELYGIIDYVKGDVMNIIHGDHEISLITNRKYKEEVLKIMGGEKILHIEENLSQLSLRFPMEFIYTPGVILQLTRALNWENINIFEIVSTLTEVNFIISEKDSSKGYRALQSLVSG